MGFPTRESVDKSEQLSTCYSRDFGISVIGYQQPCVYQCDRGRMQDDMSGRACDKLYENPAMLMKSARLQTKRGDTMNEDNFFAKSDAFFALACRHEHRDSWKSKTVDRTIRQSRQWLLRH